MNRPSSAFRKMTGYYLTSSLTTRSNRYIKCPNWLQQQPNVRSTRIMLFAIALSIVSLPVACNLQSPRGIKLKVMPAAYDELNHFAAEKSLKNLYRTYWFPQTRQYVENYIRRYIPDLFAKRAGGKKRRWLKSIL